MSFLLATSAATLYFASARNLGTLKAEDAFGPEAQADMIVLIVEKRNLSREDAYMLCSLAADLRVTQTVNGSKGIHCMIAKAVVHG